MFIYYLKHEGKVVLWHLIVQTMCFLLGVGAFMLLTANYRAAEIFVAIFLSAFYKRF